MVIIIHTIIRMELWSIRARVVYYYLLHYCCWQSTKHFIIIGDNQPNRITISFWAEPRFCVEWM